MAYQIFSDPRRTSAPYYDYENTQRAAVTRRRQKVSKGLWIGGTVVFLLVVVAVGFMGYLYLVGMPPVVQDVQTALFSQVSANSGEPRDEPVIQEGSVDANYPVAAYERNETEMTQEAEARDEPVIQERSADAYYPAVAYNQNNERHEPQLAASDPDLLYIVYENRLDEVPVSSSSSSSSSDDDDDDYLQTEIDGERSFDIHVGGDGAYPTYDEPAACALADY